MAATTCPIWGTPAQEEPRTGDWRTITSLRAGGKYAITGTAAAILGGFDDRQKALLTTWIADQHRAGESCPIITSYILDGILLRSPPSPR